MLDGGELSASLSVTKKSPARRGSSLPLWAALHGLVCASSWSIGVLIFRLSRH